MLTLENVNLRRPRCEQCGCLVDLVAVERAHQPSLKKLHEQNQFPQFVQALQTVTKCSIGEAKATYLHLADAGFCHRCKSALPQGEVVECPKCKSVNLVWQGGAA